MKNNQYGHTLAETLLVTAIVGIVAALTIPSLVKLKNQEGAVLGRAIEQIELGCQNIIQNYNSEQGGASISHTLLGTTSASDNVSSLKILLADVVRAREIENGTYTFAKVTGEYKIEKCYNNVSDELNKTIMDITIDTNGFKNKPNTNGTDQFKFELKNSGKLIPADEAAEKAVEKGFKN